MLTGTAEWLAGVRFDVDWDAVDHLPGDWLRVPALVFHGTDDATTPIATSDELAAAHPDLVELVRVAGAAHVDPGTATRPSARPARRRSWPA